MTPVRAPLSVLVAVIALTVAGCGGTPPVDSAAHSGTPMPTATPTPIPTAVESVRPEALVDLDCSDFAGVASIGFIAGVTERDPRGVPAELLDVVPLADMVVNAGGLACEFSDGGAWGVQRPDAFAMNSAWRGAAIFVVPNIGTGSDLIDDSSCGTATASGANICIVDFVAGGSWVTVVASTGDHGATFRAVRDAVKAIVADATSRPGPIERPEGTFEPSRDCESLVARALVDSALGAGAEVDRPIQLHVASEATFLTENIGCQWWRDGSDSLAQVEVLPGGGWAAEFTLAKLDSRPVELEGLHDGDIAVSHCVDESKWGYWICTVEVVVDGTWLRGIGSGPTEQQSMDVAVVMATGALASR